MCAVPGVDHGFAEKTGVEVVSAIVVVAHLLRVLRASVREEFGNELKDEELEVPPRE